MLRKALSTVPRVSRDEWKNLGLFTQWCIATRASVFVITLLASFIASILAIKEGKMDWFVASLVTLGLTFAHATNNLLNDLTDWKRGVDQDNYFRNRYGTHPMSVMTHEEMWVFILLSGIPALGVASYLVFLRGTIVLYLSLAGAFFLLFYTWPLKIMGLGEVSVFFVWGVLMIGGGYYTITQEWSWQVCVASVPYALGATAVIMGKHIDKLDEDKKKRIYTLPVLLGKPLARSFVVVMMAAQYLFTFYLIYTRYLSPVLLIVLFSLYTFPLKVYINPKPTTAPEGYPKEIWPLYYVAYAFRQNSNFGMCYVVGLILDVLIN